MDTGPDRRSFDLGALTRAGVLFTAGVLAVAIASPSCAGGVGDFRSGVRVPSPERIAPPTLELVKPSSLVAAPLDDPPDDIGPRGWRLFEADERPLSVLVVLETPSPYGTDHDLRLWDAALAAWNRKLPRQGHTV